MRLQKLVEVLPDSGKPVGDLVHLLVSNPGLNLLLDQLVPEVSAEKALDRLHVVGTEHPPEVVVQLEVRCRASRLIHRSDYVRAAMKIFTVNSPGIVPNASESESSFIR